MRRGLSRKRRQGECEHQCQWEHYDCHHRTEAVQNSHDAILQQHEDETRILQNCCLFLQQVCQLPLHYQATHRYQCQLGCSFKVRDAVSLLDLFMSQTHCTSVLSNYYAYGNPKKILFRIHTIILLWRFFSYPSYWGDADKIR